jgi:hypothetical protein
MESFGSLSDVIPLGASAPSLHCSFDILRPASCEVRYYAPGSVLPPLGAGDHKVIRDSAGGAVVLTTHPLGGRAHAQRGSPQSARTGRSLISGPGTR